jgi:uncharacterized iron-regulated membrane protein
MEDNRRKEQAKTIRLFRKVHRSTGAMLFIFFFFISVSGLLLGWKKHSNGILMAKSHKGSSVELKDWLSLDSLHRNACKYLADSVSSGLSTEIDRIDIRKDKGMLKFVFRNHYTALQLDGASGKLLLIETRNADMIEDIHDGSILDNIFGTSAEPFKLIYTSIMGLALLLFTITGFWLWYGPKLMKKQLKSKTRKR